MTCTLGTTAIGESEGRLWPHEGRALTVEFEGFYLLNLYVPNSGVDQLNPLQNLQERLEVARPAQLPHAACV